MIEKKILRDNTEPEQVILVGVTTQQQAEEKTHEYLNELEFLAYTAGAQVKKRFTQKLTRPDSKLFIGTGKADEIASYVTENNIDVVIFDDELSPSQQKNIEKIITARIVDRTTLILDIFAQRARTAYAQTQVQLAQYQYLLPRLSRMWTHLDRVKGGIGMKGAGEKEIETDRRIIRDKISLLKERLRDIDKQMITQRKSRGEIIRVSLIGYTNVGKSTIMNVLSKSEVLAENKLFATLDTTVRKVVIGNLPFLLSDTVGFIRKLPHDLIESFKSTLDEVRESDLLIHVVDIGHPNFEDHIQVVQETVKELGASDKECMYIFNKIDSFQYEEKEPFDLSPKIWKNYTIEELKSMWMSKIGSNCIFISAIEKNNLEELKDVLFDKVFQMHTARYPYQNNFIRF